MTWTISVVSELRLGSFQEDYYPLVSIWGVTAHDATGRRFAYVGPVETGTQEQAQELVARINRHQAVQPAWSPLDRPQYWTETDPVYGSEEYERQDIEGQRAAREVADDPFFYADAVKLEHAS